MLKNRLKTWLIGFIVFAVFRTIIPNLILGKEIGIKKVLVVSTCYGIALIIRKDMMDMF